MALNTMSRVTLLVLSAASAAAVARPSPGGNTTSFLFNDGAFSAFWYVPAAFGNSTIKIQYQVDFSQVAGSLSPSTQWIGIGLRSPTGPSTMGPGQFYTGQGDTLNVTARWLASGSTYPPAAETSDIIDAGCSVEDTKLICGVLRKITPDAANAQTSIDLAQDVSIMWAFGALTNDGIGYHNNNRGISKAVSLLETCPPTPMLLTETVSTSWMPLPADGSIDIFMEMGFASSNAAVSSSWIGVGFGPDEAGMGPGQFFTGQGDTLAVTDRWLASGTAYPPVNPAPNMNSFFCTTTNAIDSQTFTCGFNRPLAASASTQVDLASAKMFLKFAVGPVTADGIGYHTSRSVSSVALNFTEVSGGNVPPPTPQKPNNQLYKAHGVLMVITWLFLLPFGIFVARFRQAIGMGKYPGLQGPPVWWRIHGKVQYVGVATMTAAIVCIFVKAGWMTQSYLEGTFSKGLHEILGIVSFALTLSQPVFAILRNGLPSCSEEKRHHCHHIWHWIHGITGYGALGTGAAAVALGIEEYNLSSNWPTLFLAGYATSMGSLVLFIVFGIVRTCANGDKKSKEHSEHLLETGTSRTPDGTALNPNGKAANFVWLLVVLMVTGAVLCSIAIVQSTARDGGST